MTEMSSSLWLTWLPLPATVKEKGGKKWNELRIIRHSALQGQVITGKLDNEFKERTKAGILLAQKGSKVMLAGELWLVCRPGEGLQLICPHRTWSLIYLHVCMCDQEKGGEGGITLPPRVINLLDVLSPILTTQISSSFPPFHPQQKLVTPSSSETRRFLGTTKTIASWKPGAISLRNTVFWFSECEPQTQDDTSASLGPLN